MTAASFVNKITEYSHQLEWNLDQVSDSCFRMLFDMGEGRSQGVLIMLYEGEDGAPSWVEVSSAVMNLDGMPDGQLGAKKAQELLRENADMAFAKWAVADHGDAKHLVAVSNWRLEDMDCEELDVAVHIVAKRADDLESQLGVDNF